MRLFFVQLYFNFQKLRRYVVTKADQKRKNVSNIATLL